MSLQDSIFDVQNVVEKSKDKDAIEGFDLIMAKFNHMEEQIERLQELANAQRIVIKDLTIPRG